MDSLETGLLNVVRFFVLLLLALLLVFLFIPGIRRAVTGIPFGTLTQLFRYR